MQEVVSSNLTSPTIFPETHDSSVMRFFAFTVLGLHYRVKSGGANGWRVECDGVEIVVAYGRDHGRNLADPKRHA